MLEKGGGLCPVFTVHGSSTCYGNRFCRIHNGYGGRMPFRIFHSLVNSLNIKDPTHGGRVDEACSALTDALKGANADHRQHIMEQAKQCLERLHANEASIEARLTLFFGIVAGAMSGLSGFIVLNDKNLQSVQIWALSAAFLFFAIAGALFAAGLIPKKGYWSQGMEPMHLLGNSNMATSSIDDFEKYIILGLQERCMRVEEQNRVKCNLLHTGVVLLALAPIFGLFLFTAFGGF